MIDRTLKLPLVQQCQILELARSTAYYQPVPVSSEEIALMRGILNMPNRVPPRKPAPNPTRSAS